MPGHGSRDEEAADEEEDEGVGVGREGGAAVGHPDDYHRRRNQEGRHRDRQHFGDPGDDHRGENRSKTMGLWFQSEWSKPHCQEQYRSKD